MSDTGDKTYHERVANGNSHIVVLTKNFHFGLIILDPLLGHPKAQKKLTDSNLRETVKELAQLDGGFIVSTYGHVISAARYFNVASLDFDLLLGLGTRHIAAASISQQTEALAVVVSESSIIRIFRKCALTISRLSWPNRVVQIRAETTVRQV
jgi:DNA integrity scanning protein DisA with diadenylate cyclase activity